MKKTELLGKKSDLPAIEVSKRRYISRNMVKKKKTTRHPDRSSKTKKSGLNNANNNDWTPVDNPTGNDAPAVHTNLQTVGKGQLGFPDRVYLLASVIFQNNHLDKPAAQRLVNYGIERGIPLPAIENKEMQHVAYGLAFNTLKYQELLEEIMTDSCFYLFRQMPDEQMSLVAVMLYDFQDRKFHPRKRHQEEEIIQEVRDVESCLLGCKTKLAASLARCRVRRDLPSIECFLPESVKKKQERSSRLPLYAWVNTQRSSLSEAQSVLKTAGFTQVESIGRLEGQTFCQDPHCGDVLVFPAQLKAQLYSTELLSNHKLIIQDKFCSLGPNAACSLLPEEGDVLMLGCFSGLTVSHTASLVAKRYKANSNDQPTVYVCVSDRTDAQRKDLQKTVTATGCKNVKLILEDFHSLDESDKRLQKLRVILLTPKCSVSAVSNVMEFILQEVGDTNLLQDLSRDLIAQSKLEALVTQQKKDIDHALKFSKVSAVIYSTCSSYSDENEAVVSRALEQAKAHSEHRGKPRQAIFRLSSSPWSSSHHPQGQEQTNSFFVLEPSAESNGCFLAVLMKEPEPEVKEEPHEVLQRAKATGILDRIGPNQPTRKKRHGRTRKMRKTACTHNCSPNRTVGVQLKNLEPKGSSSVCENLKFTKKQQNLQGRTTAPRLQGLKNPISSSSSSLKPKNTNPPSLSKPENITVKKTITSALKTTTSTERPHPKPSPASLAAHVVRPRKVQQEVLKTLVLVFPPVDFPNFFLPQRRGTPTHNELLPSTRGKIPKDALVKSQPLF